MKEDLLALLFDSPDNVLLHHGSVDYEHSDWFCEVPGKLHEGLGDLVPAGNYVFIASPKHDETLVLRYNPIGREVIPGLFLEDVLSVELRDSFDTFESSYMPHKLCFQKCKELEYTFEEIKDMFM